MSTDFALRVRAALRERNLSIRAAARAMNYDPAYLARVLNGTQGPSEKLAGALDELLRADGTLSGLRRAITEEDRARIARILETPARIDARTVMALAEVLAAQRRLEDAVGVGTVLDATTAQLSRVAKLAREARGPQARSVAELAAEWRQFVGWLHIATGRHQRAARYLKDAECAALEVDSPTIAAVARSFRGYQFAERGNLAAALRFNAMNAPVPGQHPSLIVFDTFRAARAYGTLGETDAARRLIEKATKHAARLSDPPPVVYWYTHAFFLIHSGMAAYAVHDYEAAAGTLTDGLADLPPDQRAAEWAVPYHTALADSRART